MRIRFTLSVSDRPLLDGWSVVGISLFYNAHNGDRYWCSLVSVRHFQNAEQKPQVECYIGKGSSELESHIITDGSSDIENWHHC